MPSAMSQAVRLTEADTIAKLRLTEEQIAFLDRCAAGFPPRNALSSIQAIKLKLEFTTRKPKQEFEVVEAVDSHGLSDEEWEAMAQLRHQVRNG